MKMRKTLAALGAALMMIGVSAPASAFECGTADNLYDKDVIAANLKAIAEALRCDGLFSSDANPGTWPRENPIWERRRSPSCDVHSNLARKLFEKREFKDGSKPPKNQNNLVAGASWDVTFEKYEGAISKLDSFINDASKARLNSGFDPNKAAAGQLTKELIKEIDEAKVCVMHLLP